MLKTVEKPEWLRLAEQFEQSGLTQRQFAQQHQMPLSTLQSWLYRRRRQVGSEPSVPVRLLPVEVSAPAKASAGRVEVLAPGGTRVSFEVGTDVEYVSHLVAALGRASC
jgi:hypothetical protein